jgi:ABC-type molybdate transport system ATPase subunit
VPIAQPLIELCDYALAANGSGNGLLPFYLAIFDGDICAIDSNDPDDAHQVLRALATLDKPLMGAYLYEGRTIDLSNYRELLEYKRQIGYIAPDAALISNMTIRQNLLLSRYYFENNLSIDLSNDVRRLCAAFGITDILDKRTGGLNSLEVQAAIMVREIIKKPRILLLNQPETFLGHARFDFLMDFFNQRMAERLPVVFLSYDRRLVRRFANRKILITDGVLTCVDTKRANDDG